MLEGIAIRAALPEETVTIDGSFTTSSVLRVEVGEDGFGLREVPVAPPMRKEFPDDEEPEEAPVRFLAVTERDSVCGFIELEYEDWNRRLTIADLELEASYRGHGIGAALVDRAVAYGRQLGARTLWLEVSNVNVPAVRAYRRMGFELCGLDTSLYRGTPAEGEIALFMARELETNCSPSDPGAVNLSVPTGAIDEEDG